MSALDSASQLGATADDAARRTLQLTVAGELLTGVGLFGLFVAIVLHLVYWDEVKRLYTVPEFVLGGRKGLRRAMRQVNGAEQYTQDEIPHLRRLAEHRVATRRWTPATWATLLAMIALFAGLCLHTPEIGVGSAWGPAVVQAEKILSGVMALGFAVLLVVGTVAHLRNRTDVEAETFLHRTQPVPWPPPGPDHPAP